MKVKLCGLNSDLAMDGAAAARPDAIGLVFAPSVRQVTVELAARLLSRVPKSVQRWAVYRVPTPEDMAAIADLPLTGVQAEVDWDGQGLPESMAYLPVFKDGPELLDSLHDRGFRGLGRDVHGLVGAFLLDGPSGGGAGVRGDVNRASQAAKMGPMLLAGGLNPDNVAAAVRAVQPYGVDVSSGIEASRGVKDPERMVAFAGRAREAAATEEG